MGKIIFEFKNSKWIFEAADSEIQRIMLSIQSEELSSEQKHMFSGRRSDEFSKKIRNKIPNHKQIVKYMKTFPNYEFNKKILEDNFIPDEMDRQNLKTEMGRKYSDSWNGRIKTAMKVIERQEKGTWNVVKREGTMLTRKFNKIPT